MKYMIQVARKPINFDKASWSVYETYYRDQSYSQKECIQHCINFRNDYNNRRDTIEEKSKWDVSLFEKIDSGWDRIPSY